MIKGTTYLTLRFILDNPDCTYGEIERNRKDVSNFDSHLYRLIDNGYVSIRRDINIYRYNITPNGIDAIYSYETHH